ncbi:MAG: DUF151 domain-containing protein [Candidatus Aenigmarchaeota archaeon]|nr:DUF151 domain-containing protein [Candidatus Aenigmarchaeota archaeon]
MKTKNLALIAVIMAAVFFTGLLAGSRMDLGIEGMAIRENQIPQLSTEGFSKADVNVSTYIIYLTSGCYRLSMVTNDVQTDSIEKGIHNITDVRPTTHDMINLIMMNYNINPIMVKIEYFIDGTYYSKTLFRQGNNILNLDSRPSDSIAIAVRAGIPIYVKNDLLEKLGEKIC